MEEQFVDDIKRNEHKTGNFKVLILSSNYEKFKYGLKEIEIL